jgi:hypothetical protein
VAHGSSQQQLAGRSVKATAFWEWPWALAQRPLDRHHFAGPRSITPHGAGAASALACWCGRGCLFVFGHVP